MSRNNSDRDTELTIKCLRHLFLDPPGSPRTTRCLSVQEIPPAAKLWRPGKLDRIFREYVTKQAEDSSKDCEIVASGNFTNQGDDHSNWKKLPDSNCHNENVPASTVNVKTVNHIRKGTIPGKEKEESGRSKYLMQGNFNPPRKLPSPPKVTNVGNNGKDFGGSIPPKLGDNDIRKVMPSTQKSLFSTHQQQNSNGYGARNPAPRLEKRQPREEQVIDSKQEDEVPANPFKTAHQQLVINDRAKGIKRNLPASGTGPNVHVSGLRKTARYEPPPTTNQPTNNAKEPEPVSDNPEVEELMQNPLMKNIDPKMVETVLNEVFDTGSVGWDDIAGLQNVKNVIKEIIIWPMLRPDIFTGLRGPPKGILLFGPPGTGKTMIGKLIATQSKSAFFNISASSLTSKWIGDGEKMVRALFAVARVKQPSVIFIDEIDSILTQRSDTEHESSRRLKTEFLIQFDGCESKSDDKILVIGVTNRPQELDEAARRRLVKRIYIPLPDCHGRKQLVQNLLGRQNNDLTEEDYVKIAEISEGYSGADMASLCQEASYGPIRDVGVDIQSICAEEVRPMALRDFQIAIKHVKASVAQDDLVLYDDWDTKFGCHL